MKKILSFVLLCATILLASCGKDDEKITTIASVTLDQATLSLVKGTTGKLIATIAPDNADVKDLTWMTCNESVATVDAQGVVTAVGVGKATITVVTRSGGKSASCAVTVTAESVSSIEVALNKTTLSLAVGKSETLTATVLPEDATDKTVTWSSDKTAIATVDANGAVTGVTEGTAVITVKTNDSGKTATCTVTVTASSILSTGVTLNRTTLSVMAGNSETLIATILPEGATDKTVTWSSDKTSIATVSANGLVTAVAEGTAIITVKTNDSGKTATCTVTVTPASKTQVGDFYLKDGTIIGKDEELTAEQKANCVGIILKIGSTSADNSTYMQKDGKTPMNTITGYVLALHDANNGAECKWGLLDKVGIDTSNEMADFNGYKNTQMIIKFAKDNGKTLETDYPAVYYATTSYEVEHPAPGTTSGWFLPSAGQCSEWAKYGNKDVLLTSINKATDSNYTWKNYWTSSEMSTRDTNVWYLRLVGGSGVTFNYKGNTCSVRSVLAF